MSIRRPITFAFLSLLALATACNRGSHPNATGQLAPDFTVSDDASRVHLADYRGKVVLLNFWASWCGPCQEETPSLLALHHARPDLNIIAISIDEDPRAYKKFLAQYQFDVTTVRDPDQRIADMYHTEQWPETYVIDRQGRICRKMVGAQDWASPEIRDFLKSL